MNGVHDMGGMHGFGRVEIAPGEPVFHARWEGVVRALMSLTLDHCYNLDEFRHAIERIPAARYLEASYYERWLDAVERLLVEHGVVDRAALDAPSDLAGPPALQPRDGLPPALPKWGRPMRPEPPAGIQPRFGAGDHVTTRTMHPAGHTRLPRYARGKPGIVRSVNGPFLLPDANAHGLGQHWQPVYAVQFAAQDLWGPQAEPNTRVCVDVWETYLEPAPA